jgi:hypothetical protein
MRPPGPVLAGRERRKGDQLAGKPRALRPPLGCGKRWVSTFPLRPPAPSSACARSPSFRSASGTGLAQKRDRCQQAPCPSASSRGRAIRWRLCAREAGLPLPRAQSLGIHPHSASSITPRPAQDDRHRSDFQSQGPAQAPEGAGLPCGHRAGLASRGQAACPGQSSAEEYYSLLSEPCSRGLQRDPIIAIIGPCPGQLPPPGAAIG